MNPRVLLPVLIAVLLSFSESQAQLGGPNAPDSLSFQGRLTEPDGDPVADGFYDIVFNLYKDGTSVWDQSHDNVPVSGGVFNVILGGTGDASLDTVAFNVPIELGISVEGDPEISPRTPVMAAAYALGMRGMYAVDATVGSNVSRNLVGGAANNYVAPGVVGATISGGGGESGPFQAGDSVMFNWGTVGGGRANVAWETATVGGGVGNKATGTSSTVAGGNSNTATGVASAVAGGTGNDARHNWAAIGGGIGNIVRAPYGAIPGGQSNAVRGEVSFAAGRYAKANHARSFVWSSALFPADSAASTGTEQFIIGAPGGVGINTNEPATRLHIENNNLGLGPGNMQNDVVVVEGSDPVLGLYGSPGGSWNAGVTLAELTTVSGVGFLVNKWAMARNTSGGGNYLRFTFGTDPDYSANDTQMRIEPGGDVRADGSFIGGGADLAEAFDAAGDFSSYEAGDVLVISESTDRQVERSQTLYSRLVAGVYATKPGVLLSNLDIESDLSEKIPLAVLGVVPTRVTTEGGAIKRGDLLVTSSTEGHAMKADPDALGFGMVIGKALQNFDKPGSGLIEVLVNVK